MVAHYREHNASAPLTLVGVTGLMVGKMKMALIEIVQSVAYKLILNPHLSKGYGPGPKRFVQGLQMTGMIYDQSKAMAVTLKMTDIVV